MTLLCTKCRTWQITIREEQADLQVALEAVEFIRCPVCDTAPSAEFLAEIKNLLHGYQRLRERYLATMQRFAKEQWRIEMLDRQNIHV